MKCVRGKLHLLEALYTECGSLDTDSIGPPGESTGASCRSSLAPDLRQVSAKQTRTDGAQTQQWDDQCDRLAICKTSIQAEKRQLCASSRASFDVD